MPKYRQDKYYNEILSPRIPLSLSSPVLNSSIEESLRKTGLLKNTMQNINTIHLMIHPRLDNLPKKYFEQSNILVDLNNHE